jgi:hypothetical protein
MTRDQNGCGLLPTINVAFQGTFGTSVKGRPAASKALFRISFPGKSSSETPRPAALVIFVAFIFSSTLASVKVFTISSKYWIASGSEVTVLTINKLIEWPFKLAKSVSYCCRVIRRHAAIAFRRSCSARACSTSFSRAFAVACAIAISALAFTMSACAKPSVALALSDSATARFVSFSLADIRSSLNRSFTYPILIEPYVPTATANAPRNRRTLKASYQNSAQGRETSNISTLTVLGFVSIAAVWLLVVIAAIRKACQSWRRLKR